MNASQDTTKNFSLTGWVWIEPVELSVNNAANRPANKLTFDLLQPLRQWLSQIKVSNPKVAHRLCQVIPAQCPFERDVKIFGHKLFHIPPLCKLNPLYEELVSLRFRALCYLADECGEDVTSYC